MQDEGQLIRVQRMMTLPVVAQGGSLYLKVYHDLAKQFNIAEGDVLTLGLISKEIGKLGKMPTESAREMNDEGHSRAADREEGRGQVLPLREEDGL